MGAAHAHLLVVARLARAPLPGVDVHWVTRGETQPYSGMASGWVAGEYPADACTLALAPLARAAQVHLHPGGATALDAAGRAVVLAGGECLQADVLSLGVGSVMRGAELPGVLHYALDVKALLARGEALPAAARAWAVVGGGLAGVELALCLRAVAPDVSLLAEAPQLAPGAPMALARAVGRALRQANVRQVEGRAVAVTPEAVVLAGGGALPAQAVLWATGPAPHPLLAHCGLQLGSTGAVRVDASLQSTSHPGVFAAGDCADLPAAVPKSGVYSVREAQVLLDNLMAALRGQALRPYRPQRRALALVNCGDGTALASWGSLAARGHLFRAWKHQLDTGFLQRLRQAAQRTVPYSLSSTAGRTPSR